MNRKILAIGMVAVMIVSAVAVTIVSDQKSVDAVGTSDNPKIIVGSANNPFVLSIDNVGGRNVTTGYIEFNRSAFSASAVMEIIIGTGQKDDTLYYTDNAGVVTTHAKVGVDSDGNPVASNAVIDIAIAQMENASGNKDPGKLSIEMTGKTATTSSVVINIQLIVTDKTTAGGNDVVLPEQYYYYRAYVKVIDDSATLTVYDSTDSNKTDITRPSTNPAYNALSFETDYNFVADMVLNSVSKKGDYKFYATGLPSGLSMTVDGNIGGRLSNSITAGNYTSTVYAVSNTGKVVSKNVDWTVAAVPVYDFNVIIDGTPLSTSYYTMAVGDTDTNAVSAAPIAGSSASVGNVSYKISIGELGEGNTLPSAGTGTYKLYVTAEVTINGVMKTVSKTITVFVVGNIVDADLDPSVISK